MYIYCIYYKMSFSVLPDSHYEFSSHYLWQKGSNINFLRCIFTLFCFVFLKIMRKYSVSTWIPKTDIEMLPALLLPFQSLINFAGFYPKKIPTTSVALFRNIFLVEFTRWRWWSFHTSCASADVCISLPGRSCNHSCMVLQYMGQCLGLPSTGNALRQVLVSMYSQGESAGRGRGRKLLANSVTKFFPSVLVLCISTFALLSSLFELLFLWCMAVYIWE